MIYPINGFGLIGKIICLRNVGLVHVSKKTQQLLHGILATAQNSHFILLSLTVNKLPLTYTSWGLYEPNNPGDYDNCAALSGNTEHGYNWADLPCDFVQPFPICQIQN